MPHPASLYTYPWDLADEGLETALDRIAATASPNEIHLATSYHVATYFLPHNPRRQLWYGEDGMVLFQPDRRRYERLRLHPRPSELVTGPRYYEDLAAGIRARGLAYGAWMVYAYNHHMARTHADCARQDALGNRYLAQLCVGNPEVRRYFHALTLEVMERFRPQVVHLESLSYLPFAYGFLNPKVFQPIAPRDQFLMGLCFCESCLAAAGRLGMDAEAFRTAVADHLAHSLPREPTAAEMAAAADEDWRGTAFDSRLAHYLAARVETATSLYEEIARLCREHGARVQDQLPGPESEPVHGLSGRRKVAAVDRLCLANTTRPEDLPALRKQWPGKALLISYQPEDATPELPARCRAAIAAGAEGFTFYNYGLLREESLVRIGAARAAWG